MLCPMSFIKDLFAGRTSRITDIGIDTLGVITGANFSYRFS